MDPSLFSPSQEYGIENQENYGNCLGTLRDTYMNEGSEIYLSSCQQNRHLQTSSMEEEIMSRFGILGFDEEPNNFFRLRGVRSSTLPEWILDENGDIRSNITLEKVVEANLLQKFATDKLGCHFLQSSFYGLSTNGTENELRDRICKEILEDRETFLSLCRNIFGNFFLQRIIDVSNRSEQEFITKYICSDIANLCLDKSACRVIQTALERLKPRYADALVDSIPRDRRLMSICTDQNANHVIQKIVKTKSLKRWSFVVDFLCKSEEENLLNICQDKYGCRVVQTIVEILSINSFRKRDEKDSRMRLLHKLMNRILLKCHKLTSNEFANYVIQHIISDRDVLKVYRDTIIDKCLLRNLLSMSQEKYASHVVEQALAHAPLHHLLDMMEEIFDGYVPHPETGKDALDILIFHQFGNYVVQRMLQICCDAINGKRKTVLDGVDCRDRFETWLTKLNLRARREKYRLTRFSSGKKILDILQTMEETYEFSHSPFQFQVDQTIIGAPSSPQMNSLLFTSSSGWQSPQNSTSSIDYPYFE
ncbi:unnamed protein product [Caenorhabditis angaria]|uniref:PUM-HD domain-containing protein n=1 Tax=Caenorhabditis angaria TaxID=860376 RepID=A0A9P1MX09_9PELO|nr:unnamed protein product [Caenorhabditis angaria]